LKLFHVLTAIWFITGVVGRNLVLAQARKASDLPVVVSHMKLVGLFDNLMVIPGSLSVLALGLLTAWAEGAPILGLLQGAHSNWLFISLLLFFSIVALVPLIFLPRGKRFEIAMREALTQNRITSHLEAALNDRVVEAAHLYELVIITIIVILMVTKPF